MRIIENITGFATNTAENITGFASNVAEAVSNKINPPEPTMMERFQNLCHELMDFIFTCMELLMEDYPVVFLIMTVVFIYVCYRFITSKCKKLVSWLIK